MMEGDKVGLFVGRLELERRGMWDRWFERDKATEEVTYIQQVPARTHTHRWERG